MLKYMNDLEDGMHRPGCAKCGSLDIHYTKDKDGYYYIYNREYSWFEKLWYKLLNKEMPYYNRMSLCCHSCGFVEDSTKHIHRNIQIEVQEEKCLS